MASPYPNVPKVSQVEVTWSSVVQRADPDWQRRKFRELYYDFLAPGRYFYANPYETGAYEPKSFSDDFDQGSFAAPKAV